MNSHMTSETGANKAEQFHSNRIGELVSLYSPETQQRIDQLTQFFISCGTDAATAHDQAIASISNVVR